MAAESFDETRSDKVARWLSETPQSDTRNFSKYQASLSTEIFTSCLKLLPYLYPLQRRWNPKQKVQFVESEGHICLWRDIVLSGRLESCLRHSPDLYRSILDLLCNIGKTLTQFLGTVLPLLSQDPAQKDHRKQQTERLENLLLEAVTVLLSDDLTTAFDLDEYDSDTEEEEEEEEQLNDMNRVDAFLRTLQTRTRLLMETCPTLEQTASHKIRPENELTIELPEFKISDAAQHYVKKIQDRFPSGELSLVERLGEANWQRHQRLRSDNNISAEMNEQEQEPVFKFHDSALGLSLPSTSHYAASTTSYCSSVSAVTSKFVKKPRIPAMPESVFVGGNVECSICHAVVSGITGWIEWKKHVFADLQPYICTFENCRDRLLTFSSRNDWAEHEFSKHHSETSYRCHDCHKSLPSDKLYFEHLTVDHGMTKLTETHRLAMLAAACETKTLPLQEQKCPLCGDSDWPSQRNFVTHIGRHMEEIALSSLPRDVDSDSDSSESGLDLGFETAPTSDDQPLQSHKQPELFDAQSEFTKHMAQNEETYLCNYKGCSRCFTRKDILDEHQALFHSAKPMEIFTSEDRTVTRARVIAQPKFVAFTADDGTVTQKVTIPRTTRQHIPRKKAFCEFCNEYPSGFHGDHELRRHIERHHTQMRRVWICRDASEDGTFLANCKSCRNKKGYGANYNAAAHLRRAHFNPCKNKRGSRGKKSENRGGQGGRNLPSMEVLKDWMYESFEMCVGDRLIVQDLAPDVKVSQAEIDQIINEQSSHQASVFKSNSDLNNPPFSQSQSFDYSPLTSIPAALTPMSPSAQHLHHFYPLANRGETSSKGEAPSSLENSLAF